MSPFFIKHPIIAGVIAIVTTMLGIICMMGLPISQYPDIAPITIQISASYPGANAQEVADSIANPVELQLSGLENMDYMTSTSSNNGSCSISVIFSPFTATFRCPVSSALKTDIPHSQKNVPLVMPL